MGALTPARRQAAETRCINLESVGEDSFHYGTTLVHQWSFSISWFVSRCLPTCLKPYKEIGIFRIDCLGTIYSILPPTYFLKLLTFLAIVIYLMLMSQLRVMWGSMYASWYPSFTPAQSAFQNFVTPAPSARMINIIFSFRFLENAANHDFGVLQQTGERIHDVKLPP